MNLKHEEDNDYMLLAQEGLRDVYDQEPDGLWEQTETKKTLWDAIQNLPAEMLANDHEIDPDRIFGNTRDRSTTGGREPFSFD